MPRRHLFHRAYVGGFDISDAGGGTASRRDGNWPRALLGPRCHQSWAGRQRRLGGRWGISASRPGKGGTWDRSIHTPDEHWPSKSATHHRTTESFVSGLGNGWTRVNRSQVSRSPAAAADRGPWRPERTWTAWASRVDSHGGFSSPKSDALDVESSRLVPARPAGVITAPLAL